MLGLDAEALDDTFADEIDPSVAVEEEVMGRTKCRGVR